MNYLIQNIETRNIPLNCISRYIIIFIFNLTSSHSSRDVCWKGISAFDKTYANSHHIVG